jgi:hypothetical protein
MSTTLDLVEVHEVEGTEGRELFDSVCRYYLDISGDEFLARWQSGSITYQDAENDSRISRVVSVLPFAA